MYRIFMMTVTAAAALCLIALGCSGGFGGDGTGANELGPGIFGTDTT
jgi:hypothetical protein